MGYPGTIRCLLLATLYSMSMLYVSYEISYTSYTPLLVCFILSRHSGILYELHNIYMYVPYKISFIEDCSIAKYIICIATVPDAGNLTGLHQLIHMIEMLLIDKTHTYTVRFVQDSSRVLRIFPLQASRVSLV